MLQNGTEFNALFMEYNKMLPNGTEFDALSTYITKYRSKKARMLRNDLQNESGTYISLPRPGGSVVSVLDS